MTTKTESSNISVRAMVGYYFVNAGGQPHIVLKDGTCNCRVPKCAAVKAVRAYIESGGEKAVNAPNGTQIPAKCPVCDSDVDHAPELSDPRHGPGWLCRKDGIKHFWLVILQPKKYTQYSFTINSDDWCKITKRKEIDRRRCYFTT